MSTPAESKRLEAELLRLEDAVRESALSAKRSARTSIVVAVALFAIFAFFLAINYSRVSAEMTGEKLSQSFSKELGEMAPAALREMGQLGQDLMPVFVGEFKHQVEVAWPEISRSLEQELSGLGEGVLVDLQGQLTQSENRVLEKTEAMLFECYPNLRDERKLTDLHARLHATCEEAISNSLQRFHEVFSPDVKRLQESIAKFNLSDSNETPTDLQKKFIRLWIQLLDQEVSEL